MVNTQLGAVVRHIRRLRLLEAGGAGTDGELIAAFSTRNDQTAFAGLVQRYGPLVLGVCRRVLHNEHDAEDAFQATFLVLARRAGTIRKRESLGSWLHGVAYRVAMRSRQQAARRREREAQAKTVAPGDPSWKAAWQEVQVVLDEEIQALPEKYRAAFVLCCVEGYPQAEVARRLGVKEGTVWSRLAQARKLLQDRLARRGLALSAVLAATALVDQASAVPAPLAAATVKAATLFAGAGTVPAGTVAAHVLGLAKGVQKTMFSTTIKTTVLVLLTAAAVALGLGAALHEYANAQQVARPQAAEPPPAVGAPKAPPAAPRAKADAVEVAGRVLGPDGKPFAGARLLLWTNAVKKHDDLSTKATTGADGRFRFAVTPADVRNDAKVVATAKGHGPDFVKLPPEGRPAELTLRLVEDDVPITGRVLDLEGRPVVGASVNIAWMEQVDLTGWLADRKKGDVSGTGSIGTVALDGPASVKTGKDGRFRLTGVGRDRVAHLSLRDPGIESIDVEVIARPGPCDGMRLSYRPVYAPGANLIVRPGKPIVGTVRDRKTGKPIAGIKVVSANWDGLPFLSSTQWSWPAATTDEKGQYRIEGTAKQKKYAVAAGGLPYFNSNRLGVADTPGLDPLPVDFDLDRGVVVRGWLLDGATGKPVRGRAGYTPQPDNPNLKDFPDLATKVQIIASAPGGTADDGSFAVLCVPGPGWLTAAADDGDAYTATHEPGGFQLHNAVLRIEPSDKDPKSLVQDVVLQPARTLAGSVAGPDGQPLTGAYVAGLHALWRFGDGPQKLESASFRVHGLPPKEPRVVVFFHPEKHLARVQTTRADDKEPLTVRLEATGALARPGAAAAAPGRASR